MNEAVLLKIADILIENEIRWGLGASSMLYFYGLVERARDIDLIVHEDDAQRAMNLLRPHALNIKTDDGKGKYATKYFYEMQIDGQDVDFIGGYKILRKGWVYSFPVLGRATLRSIAFEGRALPVTRIEDWYAAYLVMGDPKGRTATIEAYFAGKAFDTQALKDALEQVCDKASDETAIIEKLKKWIHD